MRDRRCKWNESSQDFRADCLYRRGRERRASGGLDGAPSFADGERSSASGDSATPRLYLSAGIHGDEISGPLALLEMIRQPDSFDAFDVTMFPILNPNGLARGVRTNRDKIDLNRDYRNSRSLETKSHIETLLTLGRFEASMMLHEDYEGIGAYLYELNDTFDPGLGAKIIAAMGLHVPVDLRPEIEEAVARGGVISRRDLIAKLGRLEEHVEEVCHQIPAILPEQRKSLIDSENDPALPTAARLKDILHKPSL